MTPSVTQPSDLRKARRPKPARDLAGADRLPPHSIEAEQGLLGCTFLNPAEVMPTVLAKLGTEYAEAFYDLRHREIWHVLVYLWEQAGGFDVITVQEELKSRKLLDQVGGIAALNQLQDAVPSAANVSYYLDIVWEKFIFRQLVQKNTEQVATLYEHNGAAESFVAQVDQRHQEWKALFERGLPRPAVLKSPGEFGEEYLNVWFKQARDEHGWELPFKFPFRIRPSEMTLFTGDNGSGKSSMLALISIVLGKQFTGGEKIVLASMEMRPEHTLWIMARQLLGYGPRMEENEANTAKALRAIEWLNRRVLLYDFLGITNWRDLLDAFRYAREHQNARVFIVDSVMRIGIADDDYALQGIVAAAFADFCVKTQSHVFLVVHENKGDGNPKHKVRGSKQWTDNAHNVCGMLRNEKKAEKLEELKAELNAGAIDPGEYDTKVRGQRKTWDSKFILSKQRWPGSQQNGSRWLYFDHASLQFHEEPEQTPFNFLLE